MAKKNKSSPIVYPDQKGLYCEMGDFYIDPWRPVKNALITHAHGDHARTGSENYFCADSSLSILQHRLGAQKFQPIPYGQKFELGNAVISFHPAGHILGSAQIRIEANGEVWVVSGDYKRDPDPTCLPFEVIPCDTFITEATFALPIYHWEKGKKVFKDIYEWWEKNREKNIASVLFCYALGKAQRILAELSAFTDRSVYLHGATSTLTNLYREAGVKMLPTRLVGEKEKKESFAGELILAPPSAGGSVWMRRFGDVSTAFASGWMQIRGARRMRGHDRGFVVSDHSDWPSLLRTIEETQAKQILVTHGQSDSIVRYLTENGISALPLKTLYEGENEN